MNNIYGVDFNRLMDMIRKDGANIEWKAPEAGNQLEKIQSQQTSLTHNLAQDQAKFAASLKAFEINKRQKIEKIKKSTLSRLALIEFENSRENENNNTWIIGSLMYIKIKYSIKYNLYNFSFLLFNRVCF